MCNEVRLDADPSQHATEIASQELVNIILRECKQISKNDLTSCLLPLCTELSWQYNQSSQVKTFIIGITGSVASGKSTISNFIKNILSYLNPSSNVQAISSDGFLLCNEILNERQIMNQKGFPSSYDYNRIEAFMQVLTTTPKKQIKLEVPEHSHATYDVTIHSGNYLNSPDILIIEGVNVLQKTTPVSILQYLDSTIYVDALDENLKSWYETRIYSLLEEAKTDTNSIFSKYLEMSPKELQNFIDQVWFDINFKNLQEFILPSKANAKYIIHKNGDHSLSKLIRA